tara:strand:- start:4300 stop:5661 length:1362 start_codon:yes stop_codon:yes gene_type:complete
MIEVKIRQGGEVRSISVNQDEVVIGRPNEKRDVHVDLSPDDSVSRVHAQVWEENGVLCLKDLGSSGGTFVNGSAINDTVLLESDTQVAIGNHSLCFSIGSSASRSDEQGIHAEVFIGGGKNKSVFNLEEIYIGRNHPEREVHIDLSEDLNVSRVHAKVWRTREICWIKDENSTHGTSVNGEGLTGARVIGPEDVVQIGDCQLKFYYCAEHSRKGDDPSFKYETSKIPSVKKATKGAFEKMDSYPVYKEDSYRYFQPGKRNKSDLEDVFQSRKSPMGRIRITCEVSLEDSFQDEEEGASEFLKLLPDLITRINKDSDVNMVSNWFVNSVSKWVTAAERASFYTIDKGLGRIKLMAHKPALKPIISDILVHRALEERQAIAWKQVSKEESVRRISANAGIYVPLIGSCEEMGVICVEDTSPSSGFSEGHLSRLIIVGKLISPILLQLAQSDEESA